MGKVAFDISVSLDGYIAGPGRTADAPMGQGGDQLHNWMGSEDGQALLGRMVEGLGAVIAGRRTYDDSVRWWGADGPSGPARRPTFVVTHAAPADSPENGVYRFVSGGINAALDQARDTAGDRTVCVMGGAHLIQQFLAAGLVDEVSLHVVPVLLGAGTRLFDGVPAAQLPLEPLEVINTPTALHIRYGVVTST
ncbi:dihydrofolate reductase [Nocardia puris]|uniref:dihydrofolate reductase family protein n=1 Tax=Nocardia puris TaxID=208602 RepID=UPI001893EC4A|nr:dihydrofolate reductase family protein [Nocardia puris]MBF6215060.1 dihydrofolate reductase [Nocardia puris]MBF6367173.1 dihydrofolate reductase [Nocardia puris]MBF6461850.1 dihydrofolate reductase [Nocardia puris]